MSWNQPPGGFGNQPPAGGYGGQQQPGGFGGPPQGGQGFGSQPQGGGPGYGGQPQGGQGFGGSGYGGQQGYGGQPQQGFGPGFPPGPPGPGQAPGKKSKGMLIGIAVAAVAVVALGGLLIMLLTGGGRKDPIPQPPPPAPPTVLPTPGPTTAPPTPSPTPTPGPSPQGDTVRFGNGIELTLAPGWTVGEQKEDSVLVRDSRNRGYIVSTGRSTDPRGDVTDIIDRLADSGSDVQKNEVRTADLHPNLDVASQTATMTVASGGGSARVGIYALVSTRKSDQVGVAVAAIAPAADYQDEAFTSQIDDMTTSLLTSQIRG